jgi:acetyl esterase/lipase
MTRISMAFAALALTVTTLAAVGIERPLAAQAPAEQEIAYGRDPLQTLDFTPAQGVRGPAPLVVFVHGGGWSKGTKDNGTGRDLGPHLAGLGYNFATIDYRLVPSVAVEDQARDVAAAVRALLDRADALGIDRRRVVLMGHSAGAHLVALVGTDPQYLASAGLAPGDISGIVPIDGAAYDVERQMGRRLPLTRKMSFRRSGPSPSASARSRPRATPPRPTSPGSCCSTSAARTASRRARRSARHCAGRAPGSGWRSSTAAGCAGICRSTASWAIPTIQRRRRSMRG